MRVTCGILIAALLGCGGGDGGGGYEAPPTGPPGNTNPPPASASATVEMNSTADGYGSDSHEFSPARVNLLRGGTVTWSNSTAFMHNVTFSGTGAPQSIADFRGGTNARTFPSSGTFSYSCTNHAGMSGQVVVN